MMFGNYHDMFFNAKKELFIVSRGFYGESFSR